MRTYINMNVIKFLVVWWSVPVIFLCGATKGENKTITNIVLSLDDVSVPHYSDNPCEYFEPSMPDFRAPGRRISEVKCFQHVWNVKFHSQDVERDIACLRLKDRRRLIAGGSDASAGHYPHMGAIGWKSTKDNWIFKCGASLISDRFLLTAAHCSRVSRRDPTVVDPKPKIVRLGGHRISDYDEDGLPAKDVKIERFISHPEYRAPHKYHDIALIQLEMDVSFTWMVHPACLGANSEEYNTVTVTGWGVVDMATLQTSPTLQVAEIDLMASNDCDTRLQFARNRNWRGLVNHQMCAGYMPGGKDACMGDSGGPIQVEMNIATSPDQFPWYMHRVIGITSFGVGCARQNTPGVYTRVESFLDWIEGIVWSEQSL